MNCVHYVNNITIELAAWLSSTQLKKMHVRGFLEKWFSGHQCY